MLGHLMGILLQANRFDKACEVLNKLDKEQQKILGVPDIRPLNLFIEKAIERKSPDYAIVSKHSFIECSISRELYSSL